VRLWRSCSASDFVVVEKMPCAATLTNAKNGIAFFSMALVGWET
jgi:hypothetical protein